MNRFSTWKTFLRTTNKELSSDKAFNAFNISMVTNTDKDKVEAFFLPELPSK